MNNKKIKIIALFGKSASGKDTIQKWIVSNYPDITNGIISCTTRPKRDYEKDRIDYIFLNNEQFTKKILDGSILEATKFNNWFYGTPIEGIKNDKINVGVFNPNGIETLITNSSLDVLPIYINTSDKTRLLRSLNREENPDCKEICRRFIVDEKDFLDFDFKYISIDNNKNLKDIENTLNQIVDNFNKKGQNI